jgi:hypothetical protein
LAGWFLCFTGHRGINTHTACNSRRLGTSLASDRKKAVEITIPSITEFNLNQRTRNMLLAQVKLNLKKYKIRIASNQFVCNR